MQTLSLLTEREAVLKAISEFDDIGRDKFLAKYGFGRARRYLLIYNGRQYDSKAIVGAAYQYQTGEKLPNSIFSGGKGRVVPKLNSLGFVVVASGLDDNSAALPEEVPDTYPEGAKRTITVNAYERNSKARMACIEYHGTKCKICGFNFSNIYGNECAGFIHIHHIVPRSKIKKETFVDPVKDLIPVCPNCHAVLHNGGTEKSIKEVAGKLNKIYVTTLAKLCS